MNTIELKDFESAMLVAIRPIDNVPWAAEPCEARRERVAKAIRPLRALVASLIEENARLHDQAGIR